MATETLEAPPSEDAISSPSFEAGLSALFDEPDNISFTPDDLPPADAPVEKPPAETKPDENKAEPEPKPGSFKALKIQKDKEREDALAAQKADYETRLAELSGRATEADTIKSSYEEKLSAAESLKAAHEARATELEKKIIEDWETPYSLEVDPDAAPVFAVLHQARTALDTAVSQAATSLGEDQRSVIAIANNKALFGEVMMEMAKGLVPDSIHADNLMAGLQKIGVMVAKEEARQAIRDLKPMIPQLYQMHQANQRLAGIKATNEPNWSQTQAARHEAYRRQIQGAADVSDDATEGDDAVLAGILKGKPELREALKAESDRLSALVIGPAPGKATAAAIRSTPKALHETAVKAARLPVLMAAYKAERDSNATLAARVAELEARIANQSGAVPKSGGTPPPAGAPKVSFAEGLEEIFGKR